ncbi:MAG: 2OG-Fe(II) oxygenase [Luteolibacter sp.]
MSSGTLLNTCPYRELIDDIEAFGWGVSSGFLENGVAGDLRKESMVAWDDGEFRRAGVGRGGELAVRGEVRSDHVMWMKEAGNTVCQQAYLEVLEGLRMEMNRRFFLGLVGFEGHFAVYPEGAFYKPHLDRPRGSVARVVTVILYLNPEWQAGDGGELRIWTEAGDQKGESVLVEPEMGTLVAFLSADHWHEVLPAAKTRASITGWFKER